MKNKGFVGINIIIVIIVILVVGFIAYYVGTKNNYIKKDTERNNFVSTMENLGRRNEGVNCGDILPDEGKEVTLEGYIYPSDIDSQLRNNPYYINIRNVPNGIKNLLMPISITSDTTNIISKLKTEHNIDPSAWVHVNVSGVLHGSNLSTNGGCIKGLILEIGDLNILGLSPFIE